MPNMKLTFSLLVFHCLWCIIFWHAGLSAYNFFRSEGCLEHRKVEKHRLKGIDKQLKRLLYQVRKKNKNRRDVICGVLIRVNSNYHDETRR